MPQRGVQSFAALRKLACHLQPLTWTTHPRRIPGAAFSPKSVAPRAENRMLPRPMRALANLEHWADARKRADQDVWSGRRSTSVTGERSGYPKGEWMQWFLQGSIVSVVPVSPARRLSAVGRLCSRGVRDYVRRLGGLGGQWDCGKGSGYQRHFGLDKKVHSMCIRGQGVGDEWMTRSCMEYSRCTGEKSTIVAEGPLTTTSPQHLVTDIKTVRASLHRSACI